MQKRSKYTHGTPCWVDLTTDDLEAAKAFYKEFLCWDFSEETFGGSAPYTMATVAGQRVAGLMQQNDEQIELGLEARWHSYVAVDDLASVVSDVERLGGEVLMPPVELATQGSMAAIADPSGTLLGLWQADEHIGAAVVNEPNSLIWNELITNDVAAARTFYTALFGWTALEVNARSEIEGSASYLAMELDGAGVAAVVDVAQRHGVNRWEAFFAVADIQKMQGLASQLDGLIDDISDIGIGLIAACEDPQGARFHVMQRAQERS